ncbi:MAG: hypothetical protein WCT39_05495 [Candidatus Margulisiibacteriota bacterium]
MKKLWIIEFIVMAIFVPFAVYMKTAGRQNWIPADKAEMLLTIGGLLFFAFIIISTLSSVLPGLSSFFSNPFLGTGRDAKRIIATGRPATATVLAIDESSQGGVTTINDQPYLNLKLMIDDGQTPPYEISLDTVIARVDVPQFQPGAAFPVKIDPLDPKKVTIDIEGLKHRARPKIGGQNWTDADRKLLKEKGIDGIAKLVAVEDTGRSQDMQPVIKLSWEVTAPNLGTYPVSHETPVPTQTAQKLKGIIGKTFSTRIHPEDHNRISVHLTF